MRNNEIGDLGEAIFKVAITRDGLFRPRDLGEKWPTSDFYVELIGPKEYLHFIVQVKATNRGYDKNDSLKIAAPLKKVLLLNQYYVPTYIAGVDIIGERVFLMSINRSPGKNISRMPTNFSLDINDTRNRQALFNEVKEFWTNTDLKTYKTNFNHTI